MINKNMPIPGSEQHLYVDSNRLTELKTKNDKASLEKVAQEIEALFIQMATAEARKAGKSMESGLFSSNETSIFQDMFDKQMSLDLSKKSNLGLAKMIVKQMGKRVEDNSEKSMLIDNKQPVSTLNSTPNPKPNTTQILPEPNSGHLSKGPLSLEPHHDPLEALINKIQNQKNYAFNAQNLNHNQEKFISELWPDAVPAALDLGVDPNVLMAQAVLETGWGKELQDTHTLQPSHNLFGIKADKNWQGDKITAITAEYANGQKKKQIAQFRAYENNQASLTDHGNFLKNNPRYAQVLDKAQSPQEFFKGLQAAGYATDPLYAEKLMKIYKQLAPNASPDIR